MSTKSLSIVTRLTASFSLILILTLGLGFFAWSVVKSLERQAADAEECFMPLVEEANRMGNHVSQSVNELKDYFANANVDHLSDGLTLLNMAWRMGDNLQKTITSDARLESLQVLIISLNALYPTFLADTKACISGRDAFLLAREAMYASAKEASEAAYDFLLAHIASLHARPEVLREEQEQQVVQKLATTSSQIWELRETLTRARVNGDLVMARQLEGSWARLQAEIEALYALPPHGVCHEQMERLKSWLRKSQDATSRYISAWEEEKKALSRLRTTSTLLMHTVQYLGESALQGMRTITNGALHTSLKSMQHIIWVTALVMLLGLALALALGRSITQPLRRCLVFAESVAEGQEDQTLDLHRGDEIGRLAISINTMVLRLRTRIDDIAHAEKAMRQARTLAERALTMARAGAWQINPETPDSFTALTHLNTILGLAAADAAQEYTLDDWNAWVAALDADKAVALKKCVDSILTGGHDLCDMITPLQRPGDGAHLWVRTLLERVQDPHRQGFLFLGITQDVTEYIHQQRVLEAATRAQSSFIANMSHEIRTPLNAIIGLGHLVRRTELTPRQCDYLEKIDSAAQLLLGLINDILDLSKIQAGEMHMEGITFSLRALLRRILDMAESLNVAEGLYLSLRVNDTVPDLLVGDPLRLQQVLTNLLTNACKFTKNGSVKLSVSVEDPGMPCVPCQKGPSYLITERYGCRLRFDVTDTGMGMSQEQCEKLFRPFVQADVSITRRFGGTGLGLAISKHLAELMGGNISVKSTFGQGSTFTVTALFGLGNEQSVTVSLPQTETGSTAFLPSAKPGRILLAEDNEINAIIAREMLEAMGHTVDVAVNGAEAVRMALASDYQLVLMDVQMPIMDGISATLQLRGEERLRNLPIVAMTACAMQTDKERTQEAGMDDHLTKPIDPAVLRAVVERWILQGSAD